MKKRRNFSQKKTYSTLNNVDIRTLKKTKTTKLKMKERKKVKRVVLSILKENNEQL
jgi:hypothetical protein